MGVFRPNSNESSGGNQKNIFSALAKSLRALIASLKFADLSPRSISHILA
jgi:hypothetical protein